MDDSYTLQPDVIAAPTHAFLATDTRFQSKPSPIAQLAPPGGSRVGRLHLNGTLTSARTALWTQEDGPPFAQKKVRCGPDRGTPLRTRPEGDGGVW